MFLTIGICREIDHISNANIDDAQKALILLLELLLVEDLNRQYAVLIRPTAERVSASGLLVGSHMLTGRNSRSSTGSAFS